MFVVKRADDTDADAQSYTRDGSFSLDNEGFMITTDGHRVLSDQGQFLQVPFERVIGEDRLALEQLTIDEYGNVRAQLGRNRVENVGRVGLALFADINRLTPVGNNLFKANEASGAAELGSGLDADGLYGKVMSGALEMANTDMTSELSVLIQAQQAFSGSSRMLQAETDMTKRFTSR